MSHWVQQGSAYALVSLCWAPCQAGKRWQVSQGRCVLRVTWPDNLSEKLSTGLQVRCLWGMFGCVYVYVFSRRHELHARTVDTGAFHLWHILPSSTPFCVDVCINVWPSPPLPLWQACSSMRRVLRASHLAALAGVHPVVEARSLVRTHPALQIEGGEGLVRAWRRSTDRRRRWTWRWSQRVCGTQGRNVTVT